MEFDKFDGRDTLGADLLCDFREGAVGKDAHGLMRESKVTRGVGQAPVKRAR